MTRQKDAPVIGILPEAQLLTVLTREVAWFRRRETQGGVVELPSRPSKDLVRAVATRGVWPGVRQLEGIVEAPVLRPDGSIFGEPGYDERTGLLLASTAAVVPIVKARPTAADVRAAVALLEESVKDFPWKSRSSFSAWLAAALTIPARPAFEGPAPLTIVDANVRGAGKTLLAHLGGVIGSGRPPALCVAPKDEDELRKRITALAIEGAPVVLIDNVTGQLGWPSLDALITSPDQTWNDRVLRESTMVRLRFKASWWVTANNAAVSVDTARRSLWVRLESEHERPEEREDITNHQPEWTLRRLPELQAAALTILAGYVDAGRPDQHLPAWGSFGAWSALPRSAVVWAGLPDPAETRTELLDANDATTDALRRLLFAWANFVGVDQEVTTAHLLGVLFTPTPRDVDEGVDPVVLEMRAALEELLPGRDDEPPSAKSVGWMLRKHRDRVVGGLTLTGRKDDGRGVNVWRVRQVGGV